MGSLGYREYERRQICPRGSSTHERDASTAGHSCYVDGWREANGHNDLRGIFQGTPSCDSRLVLCVFALCAAERIRGRRAAGRNGVASETVGARTATSGCRRHKHNRASIGSDSRGRRCQRVTANALVIGAADVVVVVSGGGRTVRADAAGTALQHV